jgi:hypothetical protein
MFCPESKERGFTRIELCVLMAGIGLLGMIALPLRAGNPDSRTVQCLDNLRRLAGAMAVYALDNGWFPPNDDVGTSLPGMAWVSGNAGPGGEHQFNPDILRDASRSMLYPYLDSSFTVRVFACPADERSGRYQGTDPALQGTRQLAARSVSLNSAVGVNPYMSTRQATDGAWLDNNRSHTYGKRWRTYGKPEHVVAPSPSRLFTFIDEDSRSIYDGTFVNGMQVDEWAKSPSENWKGPCDEDFWPEPRRRGRRIPAAGCNGRANAGSGQKDRRPEGFRGNGRLASWLLGHRPLSGMLPRRASPSGHFLENRAPSNFQTGSKPSRV